MSLGSLGLFNGLGVSNQLISLTSRETKQNLAGLNSGVVSNQLISLTSREGDPPSRIRPDSIRFQSINFPNE